MLLEALFVDGLDAEKHVLEADLAPELEDLFVPQKHVAARLEVILLANSLSGHGLANFHAMPGLDEGHVVDDEDARFADRSQLVDDGFRAFDAIAATVERPGTTKRAIPGAAPAEFDRRTRIEHADEVFPALGQQVAGRDEI